MFVWGGWHPTFVPDQTIAHPDVDYIVTGVGEQKIVDLSRYFESGAKGNLNIEGVLQKERGGIKTPWKEKPPNMRIMPAYHLVDVDAYRSENNIAGMISARGCPFRCNFCTIANVAYVNRDIDCALDEIEFLLNEKKFDSIKFVDGLFFAQRSRVFKFLERAKDRGLSFEWRGSVRPETFGKYSDSEMDVGYLNLSA